MHGPATLVVLASLKKATQGLFLRLNGLEGHEDDRSVAPHMGVKVQLTTLT